MNNEDLRKKYNIVTMVSPTKPGPGWIKVTPENISFFEQSCARIEKIRDKLKEFKAELLAD